MRLSRILYCIVPLSLLLLIGCSNYSEQQVNGLYYQCQNCGDLDDSTFSMIMEEVKLKEDLKR